MNKLDLARMFARERHRSRGRAADAVDRLVYDILKDLKRSSENAPAEPEREASGVPVSAPKDKP